MSLEPGARLGVFEVLGPIGAGGMGEVYRARDTRLGRDVAIKVLPEAFAREPTRVARFEREARMLASINHPAIAAIYGAEESGDVRYIVMELVPGDTLADRLVRGQLSLEESLSFARQIAEALEAAHEKGVIHRDLKPANIKVTPEGRVKVLDLGLAKAMEMPGSGEGLSNSPTVTLEQTRPGTIIGTVEFMSPEQARGKEVDKRTDIWAFGCILYEMLSGRRTFAGETISDVLVAILSREPDWDALPSNTPPRIRELLARCLEKDVSKRLRDIGDARMEVERELSGESRPAAVRRGGWTAAAGLTLVLFGIVAWLALRPRTPAPEAPEKSLVVLPANVMGDSPGREQVGDGLVETLSARLNDVPGIQIVTPSAAVAASDKNADPFGAARSVGANLVVRSSVVRSGERVRIIYSVWNVQTRYQVAGGTVDGSASDLFGMQDQLAENVAAALKLPKPAKKTPTPTGLETASQQERYVQALGHLQRYDKAASVDEAIRLLESLEKERPGSGLVHAALARGYLFKFNLTRERSWADRAIASSGRAQELNASLPEVDVTVAEVRLRTGQPGDAVAAFQRALAAQPNNWDALLGLARALDASGNAAEAEKAYKRAIKLQPTYWAGYSKLGGFYFNHGQIPKAAEMFRRVTELTPDNARAFNNLGGMYELMGDFNSARNAYKKSISLERTSIAYGNLGTLEYFLGDFKKSSEAFEKASELTPNDFQYWAEMGDAYRWIPEIKGRAKPAYERAIRLALRELELNPKSAFAHAKLAMCYAKTGRQTEGDQHIRRALELDPKNPSYMYDAAIVSAVNGKTKEAIEWLRQSVAAGYGVAHIQREPEFARLRNEESFRELLKTVSPKGF